LQFGVIGDCATAGERDQHRCPARAPPMSFAPATASAPSAARPARRAVRTRLTRLPSLVPRKMMLLGSYHFQPPLWCKGAGKLGDARASETLSGGLLCPAKSASDRTMPAPKQPKRNVRIDSEKYLIRTIGPDDASDRWASWMSDPEVMHMLNLRARTWKKADVLDYMKKFDQQSSLLLGIFEKQSGTHIGIFTVDINHVRNQFLVNLLIGELEYRNKHVTSSIAMSFHEYFFETLGLKMAMASVLARNAPMIHYLQKNGWKLDQTLKHSTKSYADGAMLDVCLFSLSRDAWRRWKKENLAQSNNKN